MSTQTVPARRTRSQLNLTVVSRTELSPAMVRLVTRLEQPERFVDIEPPEKYVKLVFFPAELDLEPHPDYWTLRESLPPAQQPVTRHMTLRRVDAERGELWIDIALHGDEGYAGPWAAAVQPGDTIVALGPGGRWIPDPDATWTLFAADDSAIPAALANLEALPADARGEIHFEVECSEHELKVDVPHGFTVHWSYRQDAADGRHPLVDSVEQADWPADRAGVQVFAHGERGAMKALRPILFETQRLERSQVSLSGYWAQGRAEEVFQAEKREPIGQI